MAYCLLSSRLMIWRHAAWRHLGVAVSRDTMTSPDVVTWCDVKCQVAMSRDTVVSANVNTPANFSARMHEQMDGNLCEIEGFVKKNSRFFGVSFKWTVATAETLHTAGRSYIALGVGRVGKRRALQKPRDPGFDPVPCPFFGLGH